MKTKMELGKPALASISETVEAVKSTITVSDSFVPLFFVSKERDTNKNRIKLYLKRDLSDFTRKIINSLCNGSLKPINIEKELNFKWIKDLHNQYFEMLSIVLGRKSKEEATKTYNKFIQTIDNAYKNYVDEHEILIKDIEKSISDINKEKSHIKYDLIKLAKKLSEIGICSQVSDYDFETLDLRNFPIKQEYNIIEQEKLEIEKSTSNLLDLYLPFSFISNFIKAKELNDKRIKLKKSCKLIFEKMNSDLVKMGVLSIALDNIAKIFKQTVDVLIPIIENIIDEISKDFDNDYYQIPEEKITILHNSSSILKYMTEKRILKKDFSITDISNDITKKFKKIEEEVNNAA